MENNRIKPRLGSVIYLRFDLGGTISINKETVLAVGKDIFFHTGALDTGVVDSYRSPLRYDQYGEWWFKTLKEATEKLGKLTKVFENYWEVVLD